MSRPMYTRPSNSSGTLFQCEFSKLFELLAPHHYVYCIIVCGNTTLDLSQF
jgi:hypothetical protein